MCRAWALKGNFNPSSEFYGKEIYSRNIQIIGPPPSSHLHQSPPSVRASSQSAFQEVVKDDL